MTPLVGKPAHSQALAASPNTSEGNLPSIELIFSFALLSCTSLSSQSELQCLISRTNTTHSHGCLEKQVRLL